MRNALLVLLFGLAACKPADGPSGSADQAGFKATLFGDAFTDAPGDATIVATGPQMSAEGRVTVAGCLKP
jgi:hypothetical protein